MKFVVFTIFLMIAMAMAAFQAEKPAAQCRPVSLPCQKYEDCCRDLMCQPHANICIPVDKPDPNDNRPIGPKMPY